MDSARGPAAGVCPRCPGPTVPHHCGLCPKCPGPKVPHRCGLGLTSVFGLRLPSAHVARGGAGKGVHAGVPVRSELPPPVLVPGHLDRGRVLGKGGENFKFICELTGARLSLETRSDTSASSASSASGGSELMHVRIFGGRDAKLKEAAALVRDLLETLGEPAARPSNNERRVPERQQRRRGDGGDGAERARAGAVPPPPEPFAGEPRRSSAGAGAGRRAAPRGEDAEAHRRRVEALRDGAARRPKGSGKGKVSQQSREELRDLAAAKLAEAEELRQAAETMQMQMEILRAEGAGREELEDLREMARQLTQRVQALEKDALSMGELSLSSAAGASSGDGRVGGFCALFPLAACPFECGKCPRGAHGEPPAPSEDSVLVPTTRAKRGLLQQKWQDAGGPGQLVGAWQVRNPRLDLLLRATESDFAGSLGAGSDVIDGWHGTPEENVLSIAVHGFDPSRRAGQAYGAGEYFAKDPNVSVSYSRGGSFMFLCKLVLGQADLDHTWVPGPQYYVLAQREGRVQAVPLFLVQFSEAPGSPVAERLTGLSVQDDEEPLALAARQPGALHPCEARRDAGMSAEATRHLWIGWLSPALRTQDDDAVSSDVEAFLHDVSVDRVIPERNGARVGAFVLLREPIGQATFRLLQRRPYAGRYRISVDDAQPRNPRVRDCVCPRLKGPSRYCRGWNIRGHQSWQWGCSYQHPKSLRPTHGADYRLEELPRGSAKFDEICTELTRAGSFVGPEGASGTPSIVAVHRLDNPLLARAYEERRGFLHDKQGFAMEKELWHGTSCKAIPELVLHGLQPPSDTCPSSACPVSGGKGLCTTLCGTDCEHCAEAHVWGKCHMYGLGVYLADLAQKSHRYVREPADTPRGKVYSLLRCRVVLGNPYLIDGNLLKQDALHDMCWCQNPSEAVETCAEQWSVAKGHDAFYVRGQAGAEKAGLGVYNSEYVVFHPYQILPLYQVDYTLE